MFDTAKRRDAKLVAASKETVGELTIETLDAVAGGMHVTRKIDAASPNLYVACSSGEHLKSAS